MKQTKNNWPKIIKTITALYFLVNASHAYTCDKAQLVDYDYQIKESLSRSYSTFGRFWLLDDKEFCVNSLKYGACISIKPAGKFADITIKINKEKGTSSTYHQQISYNSSELIRFNTMSMDVYLKVFISNTIADMKMSGKSCESSLPNIPRQVTRKELDNMFSG